MILVAITKCKVCGEIEYLNITVDGDNVNDAIKEIVGRRIEITEPHNCSGNIYKPLPHLSTFGIREIVGVKV